MKLSCLAGKHRAGSSGAIANGDDIIEAFAHHLDNRLGPLLAYVDSNFSHYSNCSRIDESRSRAGARDFKTIRRKMSQRTFCHLAAARVSSTQKQDPLLFLLLAHKSQFAWIASFALRPSAVHSHHQLRKAQSTPRTRSYYFAGHTSLIHHYRRSQQRCHACWCLFLVRSLTVTFNARIIVTRTNVAAQAMSCHSSYGEPA